MKAIPYLFFPVCLVLFAFAAGLAGLYFRKGRWAKFFLLAGLILLILFTNRPFGNVLLAPLEDKFPPLRIEEHGDARFVVVLAGSLNFKPDLPITSQMTAPMMIRLTEGIRIHKALPHTKLVLSGGGRHAVSEAEMMRRLAGIFGVDPENMILEAKSLTTYEEAALIQPIVRGEKFILVTSARHMPRSMALFRKFGMSPVPAPTNHLVRPHQDFPFENWIPHANNLVLCSEAVYEYMGLLKEALKGRI